MTITEKLKEVFVPSIFTGLTAAGILFIMDKDSASYPVEIVGMKVPGAAMIGTAAFVGNMAGEVLTDVVLPYAEKELSKDFTKIENIVIPPALSGLSTYGAVRFLTNLTDVPLVNVGLIGAGSSVVGNYAYDQWYKIN